MCVFPLSRLYGRFMKDTYTPFLLSAKGKALVLLGSVALFAAGVYGVVEVREISTHNLRQMGSPLTPSDVDISAEGRYYP